MKVQQILLVAAAAAISVLPAFAQDQMPRIGVSPDRPLPVAVGNNLYCAGYIQTSGVSTADRIVGANDEADKHIFAQNDYLYINVGGEKGSKVGDVFTVIRPRGSVKSHWSRKSDIGFYVQEVGAVEVVAVKAGVSVARVRSSCDNFLLGDLVQRVERRNAPLFEPRPALDQFANPSGKVSGRILMSRDGAEMLAKDFIAYVDLGADDSVRIGDRLTVYRKLGKGNPYYGPESENYSSRDYGYQSLVYKGGKFSNQSGRKSGEHAGGKEVTTKIAKEDRPDLRKVLGEAVVLNVKEKTATILITRNVQEIHTGDSVEIQ